MQDDGQGDFRKLADLLRLCADTLAYMTEQRPERFGQLPDVEDLTGDLQRIASRVDALAAPRLA